jgi:hypothetical protein
MENVDYDGTNQNEASVAILLSGKVQNRELFHNDKGVDQAKT